MNHDTASNTIAQVAALISRIFFIVIYPPVHRDFLFIFLIG